MALLLAGGVAQAGIVLDGAHLLNIDPNTGSASGGIFSTSCVCAGAYMYVGSFAGANLISTTSRAAPDTWSDMAYSVPIGTTHMELVGAYAYQVNGVDLFFNMPFGTGNVGASGPSITAYLDGSNALSSGIVGSTQPSYGYTVSVPNGGLSFTSGTQTVTLSNYATGYESGLYPFASFDLTVTDAGGGGPAEAPEPGTVWLMMGASAGLLAVRRRFRRA